MKYCGECGARIEGKRKYCTACGAPVGVSLAKEKFGKTESISRLSDPAAHPPLAGSQSSPRPSAAHNSKNLVALVGASLFILSIAAYYSLHFSGSSEGPSQAPTGTDSAAAVNPSMAPIPASPPTPAIDSANLVTTDGMMGIITGQSWAAVSSRFKSSGVYGAEVTEGCEIYESLNKRVSAMVENGKVTRLETTDPAFKTRSRMGVGSTLSELADAYGSRLTSEENPYSGRDYFFESTNGNGIKFHVEDGKVTDLTVGGNSIRYVEGCL